MENLQDNLWSLSAQKYFWLEEPEIKEDVVPEAEDIASEDELDDEMASLIDSNADDTEISDNDFNFDNL